MLALLAAPLVAQKDGKRAQRADDFQREGRPEQRAKKDPLEGKIAPRLQVQKWMNIKGKSLSLSKLKGKVVAIKFWGVW